MERHLSSVVLEFINATPLCVPVLSSAPPSAPPWRRRERKGATEIFLGGLCKFPPPVHLRQVELKRRGGRGFLVSLSFTVDSDYCWCTARRPAKAGIKAICTAVKVMLPHTQLPRGSARDLESSNSAFPPAEDALERTGARNLFFFFPLPPSLPLPFHLQPQSP